MTLLVKWHHWYQHHMMSVSTVNVTTAFLWSRQLKQDVRWLFGHGVPLAFMSHDANSFFNGTTAFRSRWLNWCKTWLFWSCGTTGISAVVTWCQCHKCHHDMTPMASSLTHGILRSRHLTWGATWHFWSYDVNSTGTEIMSCWWCHQFVPLYSLCQDYQNKVQHNTFGHVMSLASAPYIFNAIITDTWYWCQNWYWHWHQKSYNIS